MILNLNTKHGFEVWINQQLVKTIEEEFKKVLETDDFYYYYIPCQCHKEDKKDDNVKWVGKTSLIDFIKKVQKIDSHFCAIGVTNAKSKKKLKEYFDRDFYNPNADVHEYWIGDVVHQKMVCGDELFIKLWERVRDQATKDSKTRKNFF